MIIYFRGKKFDTNCPEGQNEDGFQYVINNKLFTGLGRHWSNCYYIKFNKETQKVMQYSVHNKQFEPWGGTWEMFVNSMNDGEYKLVSKERAEQEVNN